MLNHRALYRMPGGHLSRLSVRALIAAVSTALIMACLSAPVAAAEGSVAADGLGSSNLPDVVLDSELLADGRVVSVGYRESADGSHDDAVVALWGSQGSLQDVVVLDDATATAVDSRVYNGAVHLVVLVNTVDPDWTVPVVPKVLGYQITPAGLEVDAGFNGGQPSQLPTPEEALGSAWTMGTDLTLDPTGRVVATAHIYGGVDVAWVARLTASGLPDTSFNEDGAAILHGEPGAPAWSPEDESVAVQSDSKVVVAMSTLTSDGHKGSTAARLTVDGWDDTTFHLDGYKQLPVDGDNGSAATDVQIDKVTGKVVVAATSYDWDDSRCLVLRLTTSGYMDNLFSGDGVVSATPNGMTQCTTAGLTVYQQRIRVSGLSYYPTKSGIVSSFDRYGRSDTTWGNGTGTVVLPHTGTPYDSPADLESGSKGEVVVAGALSYLPEDDVLDSIVGKLTSSGALNTSFAGDGVAEFDFSTWAG